MKKFLLFGAVFLGIAAVVFLVVAAAAWMKFYPRNYTPEELAAADPVALNYCDLINHPWRYDNEIVRVKADLRWFQHGYYFADAACSSEGDAQKTALIFEGRDNEELWNFLEKVRAMESRHQPLRVTAVGVFRRKIFYPEISDEIEDRTALRFELYKIETPPL